MTSMRPAIATVCSLFTPNTNIVFVCAWRASARWTEPGFHPGSLKVV